MSERAFGMLRKFFADEFVKGLDEIQEDINKQKSEVSRLRVIIEGLECEIKDNCWAYKDEKVKCQICMAKSKANKKETK